MTIDLWRHTLEQNQAGLSRLKLTIALWWDTLDQQPSAMLVLCLSPWSYLVWLLFSLLCVCVCVVLLSRAPITCIRCNKIRCSGYLKCGRCGDAFRAQPLVTHAWEGGASQDLPPPAKRSRESLCESSSERVQSVGKFWSAIGGWGICS